MPSPGGYWYCKHCHNIVSDAHYDPDDETDCVCGNKPMSDYRQIHYDIDYEGEDE